MSEVSAHPAPRLSAYEGVRVLVTGASGFIGRWVARRLSLENADLVLGVRDPRAMREVANTYGIRGDIRQIDFTDPTAIEGAIRDLEPAITFNAVGYGVDRAERDESALQTLNADAVAALATAIERTQTRWPGAQLIHIGSAQEYGEAGGDLREDVEPRPTNAYGETKLRGTTALTRIASEASLRALTARLFTVYGPGEHAGRLLPSLIDGRRSGQPVRLSGGLQRRDFTYVEDVAQGLLLLGLSNAPPGWIVNLATGRLTSVREFAETAAGVLGMPLEGLQFGTMATYASEMEHRDVSIRRLRSLLGWAPATTIRDGILATWDFLSSGAGAPA